MSTTSNSLKKNFSQIPNNLIIDNRLSHGAKIVMIYLLSLPDNWVINNADVMKKLDIKSEDTLAKYWKELITNGWIHRNRKQNEKGHFDSFEYILHFDFIIPTPNNCGVEPTPILPVPENTRSGGIQDLNNTHYINNTHISNTIPTLSKESEGKTEIEIQFEDFERQKKISEGAYQTWLMILKEYGIELTERELIALRGYTIAKPNLPIHLIKSNCFTINTWIEGGLDVEKGLLSSTQYKGLAEPRMLVMEDARGNRLNRQACILKRQEQIQKEKSDII